MSVNKPHGRGQESRQERAILALLERAMGRTTTLQRQVAAQLAVNVASLRN
jgi:hypothetical protein